MPLLAAFAVAACASASTAQSETAVRTLWSDYLAAKQGQYAGNAGQPSTHWDAAEADASPTALRRR